MDVFKGELVATADGSFTLKHPLYDEEFHATQGARMETQALYIDGSSFCEALGRAPAGESCGVLDVGLGLGYNALATLEAWMQSSGCVSLVMLSLEISPELYASLRDPASSWKKDWSPEWRTWSEDLPPLNEKGRAQCVLSHPSGDATFTWHVAIGDALRCDFAPFAFDFIWQDAFSPKKNAELWSPAWFQKIRAASRSGCTLMTYSVARIVKDSLIEGGWTFEKFRAPSYKKEWLRATIKTI